MPVSPLCSALSEIAKSFFPCQVGVCKSCLRTIQLIHQILSPAEKVCSAARISVDNLRDVLVSDILLLETKSQMECTEMASSAPFSKSEEKIGHF